MGVECITPGYTLAGYRPCRSSSARQWRTAQCLASSPSAPRSSARSRARKAARARRANDRAPASRRRRTAAISSCFRNARSPRSSRTGTTTGRMSSTRISSARCPTPATQPLFDCARELGVGFYLGYAELAVEDGATHRFNTSILVDKERPHPRQVPQGSSARPRRARAVASVPEPRESATSKSATWASRCSARSAASSAWRSATTAAGPRPIA